MTIKELKKELGFNQSDLAEFFGMSYNAFANSSAKERYENAIVKFYEFEHKQKSTETFNCELCNVEISEYRYKLDVVCSDCSEEL